MGVSTRFSRGFIQWAFALVVALGVGVSIFVFLQSQSQRYENNEQKSIAYFVIREIPEGTALSDVFSLGFVESREVLTKSKPAQAVSDANDPINPSVFSQKNISSGQILLSNDFGTTQVSTSGLSLPEGSVAISVRLGDVERISPFLRPGNEVAIFATGQRSNGSGTITTTLIPRVQILGIGDARFISGQGYVPSGDPSIVTFAVRDDEAGKLIQASKTFSLYLALLDRNSTIPLALVTTGDIVN